MYSRSPSPSHPLHLFTLTPPPSPSPCMCPQSTPSPNTSHLPHTPHPHPTPHTSLTLPTLTPHQQLLLNMNFSSRTSSMDVQRTLESNVEKRTKDSFGPPPGKRLLVFIDDMNMPKVYVAVCTGHTPVWAGLCGCACTGHTPVRAGLCGCACTGHTPVRAVWMCMHRTHSCTDCVDVLAVYIIHCVCVLCVVFSLLHGPPTPLASCVVTLLCSLNTQKPSPSPPNTPLPHLTHPSPI